MSKYTKTVYVAGQYTQGDTPTNVRLAMEMSSKLIDAGFAPFCPHLSHFLHMTKAQPYEAWLAIDITFLKKCDVMLRMSGFSPGADREETVAKGLGIPVYYDLSELLLKETV